MESNNPIEIRIAEDNPGDGRLIEDACAATDGETRLHTTSGGPDINSEVGGPRLALAVFRTEAGVRWPHLD